MAYAQADETFSTKSKKAIKEYKEGRIDYERYQYADAVKAMLEAIKADSMFVEAYALLGQTL